MLPNLCEIKENVVSKDLKSKNFWIHGEPGTWKTTVSSKFPKALIAAGEIGFQFINGVRAVIISSWSDMKDLYRQLKTPQVKEFYDTIVFDNISVLANYCTKYALGQLGVNDPNEAPYGQGWRKIKDEWRLIDDIVKLGYCIVFISHSKENEVTDKNGETRISVKTDLESWAQNSIWGLSDFVLYVRKELEEDGTENVYAYSDLPNIDTKRRHQAFPKRMLFSYDNIVEGLDNIVKAELEAGHEVKENNASLRIVNEESIDVIRDNVIQTIKELVGSVAENEMNRYISEMFDVRISQTTELHRPKLIAARDYLNDLKAKTLGK